MLEINIDEFVKNLEKDIDILNNITNKLDYVDMRMDTMMLVLLSRTPFVQRLISSRSRVDICSYYAGNDMYYRRLSMRYVAKFNIEGGTLPKVMNGMLIDEFVRRRELAIEQFNPNYEKWNKEFNTLYPELDGYSEKYIDFIREKHKDGLNIANRKVLGLNLLELKTDGDGDIYGVTRLFDHTTIHVYLVEEA